jgi:hypothetical protein
MSFKLGIEAYFAALLFVLVDAEGALPEHLDGPLPKLNDPNTASSGVRLCPSWPDKRKKSDEALRHCIWIASAQLLVSFSL